MAKLRCWPGCLAIVINSSSPNFGRTVKVVRLHTGNDSPDGIGFVPSAEPCWRVEAPGGLLTRTVSGLVEGPFPWTSARDISLLPITPPPGTESETESVADLLETARCEPAEA